MQNSVIEKAAELMAEEFSPEELSTTSIVLQSLKQQEVGDESIETTISILTQAIKIRTESLIYAFSWTDWYAARTEEWPEEWVSLYRRMGDTLNKLWNSDFLLDSEEVIHLLKKEEVSEIITWPIHWKFLWLSSYYKDFDNDESTVSQLSKWYIFELEKIWIKVRICKILN